MLTEDLPEWTRERHERMRARIHKAVARRQRRQTICVRLATAITFICLVAVAWRTPSSRPVGGKAPSGVAQTSRPMPQAVAPSPSRAATPPAQAPDASQRRATVQIRALGRSADIEDVTAEGARLVRLKRGGLHIQIEGPTAVPVRVLAREYTIEHLGTTFSVALEPNGAVRVTVDEGSVRITGRSLTRIVEAGQTLTLTSRAQPAQTLPQAAPVFSAEPPKPAVKVSAPSGLAPEPLPKELAPVDDVATLLLWVDEARAAGRIEAAITHLDALLAAYPRDRRRAMAHFLRGKLLMEAGRPAQAAEDFDAIVDGPLLADAKRRAAQARHAASAVVPQASGKAQFDAREASPQER